MVGLIRASKKKKEKKRERERKREAGLAFLLKLLILGRVFYYMHGSLAPENSVFQQLVY